MFHCSSIHINHAAQRSIKLSGSSQGPWLILTALFCCRMHLTAEDGAAETGSAEASGCVVKSCKLCSNGATKW